jgi:hypothetical protein
MFYNGGKLTLKNIRIYGMARDYLAIPGTSASSGGILSS